jgi:hypothetical protein
MPPIKGKPRRQSALRCFKCGSRKIRVERGSNQRVIHGKVKTVANCECTECQNEWWSYHPEAIAAMREADKRAKVSRTTTVVTTDGVIKPARHEVRANPHDVDRTER